MKEFHITVVFANGLYSHTTHFKAESEKDAIMQLVSSPSHSDQTIISITILEK